MCRSGLDSAGRAISPRRVAGDGAVRREPPQGAADMNGRAQDVDCDVAHPPVAEKSEASDQLTAHEDVADDRQAVDQRGVLVDRLDADPLAVASRLHDDRRPVDEHVATVGRNDARHHLDQGRFAGAVIPQQSDDLAGAQMEVETVEGGNGAEALGNAARLVNRRRHDRAPRRVSWLRMAAPTISAPTKISR